MYSLPIQQHSITNIPTYLQFNWLAINFLFFRNPIHLIILNSFTTKTFLPIHCNAQKKKTIKRNKKKKKNGQHGADVAGSHLIRPIPLAEAVTDNWPNDRRCHVTKADKKVWKVTMIKPKVIYLLERNLLKFHVTFHRDTDLSDDKKHDQSVGN